MKRCIPIILVLLSVLNLRLTAIPAREGFYTLRQPDGSTLRVHLRGDEFCRLLTTADGNAIALDKDGYYKFATYDAQGKRHATSYRADRPAPTSILDASRSIPYQTLSRNGSEKRLAARHSVKPMKAVSTKAGTEKRHGLVILAEFTDLKFKNSRNRFVSMLNEKGYNYNNATGSAADYFNEQFKGIAEFDFDVSDVVTLSHGYAYYGENGEDGFDKRPGELVAEACRMVDNGIDFSRYDYDGDGEVDNVYVFVAGRDEAHGAGEDYIWSHSWALYDGAHISLTLDGKKINCYALSTEIGVNSSGQSIFTGIGTFCHEFSHTLGLADLYDTDYEESGGKSDALWKKTSIMDGGNYNNDSNTPPNYSAVDLYQLGIGERLTLEPGAYSLEPIGVNRAYAYVPGDRPGECYLFECRSNDGWDRYIGTSGMLIYHIDMSDNAAGWSDKYSIDMTAEDRWFYNEVNCRPEHQCADLIEASPTASSVSQIAWPFGKSDSFKANTKPAFRFWSGKSPEIAITNISRNSSGVSFNVTGPLSVTGTEAFQDAAIIHWSCSDTDVNCTISCNGKTLAQVRPYDDSGNYSYTLEGLNPKTRYEISISAPGIQSISTAVTTMSMYSDGYPFIYMGSTAKNSDGSVVKGSHLSLRVFNCNDARSIRWTLNGSSISPEGDGYFTLNNGGFLKAEILHNDGSIETITKRLTVK